jgi:hypothetical protein
LKLSTIAAKAGRVIRRAKDRPDVAIMAAIVRNRGRLPDEPIAHRPPARDRWAIFSAGRRSRHLFAGEESVDFRDVKPTEAWHQREAAVNRR